MSKEAEILLNQIDQVLSAFGELQAASRHDDASDQPDGEVRAILTRAIAFVHRVAGPHSAYATEIRRIQEHEPHLFQHSKQVIGVARGLREDLAGGYLETLRELIHSDQMGDLLGMSQELLESGYKDAAAVMCGVTLEAHIRNLCRKNGIDVEDRKGSPKKLDRLNADLARADVYGKLDQKSVTAWADLRNKAAHGEHQEYDGNQVALMLEGVRGFVTRHPA